MKYIEAHEKARNELRRRGYRTDAAFVETDEGYRHDIRVELFYQPESGPPNVLLVLFRDGDWDLYSQITTDGTIDTWNAFDKAAEVYLQRQGMGKVE